MAGVFGSHWGSLLNNLHRIHGFLFGSQWLERLIKGIFIVQSLLESWINRGISHETLAEK